MKLTVNVSEYTAAMDAAKRTAHRRLFSRRAWTGYVILQSALCGALATVVILAIAGVLPH